MTMTEAARVHPFPTMETPALSSSPPTTQTIRECVECAVRHYFNTLEDHSTSNLYDMVLAEMEAPLLKVVLEHTNGNQSQAADILGLNRGTLRKKMKAYHLLQE